MKSTKEFTTKDFEEACIVIKIEGRFKCPECGSNLVEVYRDFGVTEVRCLRFKEEKIRCSYGGMIK